MLLSPVLGDVPKEKWVALAEGYTSRETVTDYIIGETFIFVVLTMIYSDLDFSIRTVADKSKIRNFRNDPSRWNQQPARLLHRKLYRVIRHSTIHQLKIQG